MYRPIPQEQIQAMHDRAERVRKMIHRRAVDAYNAAFGAQSVPNSSLDMCVIHNSMIDYDRGTPWREVNYSHMRNARRLIEKSFEPSRIVSAWYTRKTRGSQ